MGEAVEKIGSGGLGREFWGDSRGWCGVENKPETRVLGRRGRVLNLVELGICEGR